MRVNVNLFPSLNDGRFKTEIAELDNDSCVIDVINKYKLPEEEVDVCYVNGHNAENEQVLHDGDTVMLFPTIGGA